MPPRSVIAKRHCVVYARQILVGAAGRVGGPLRNGLADELHVTIAEEEMNPARMLAAETRIRHVRRRRGSRGGAKIGDVTLCTITHDQHDALDGDFVADT